MSGSHRVEDNKVAYTHDGLGFSADIQFPTDGARRLQTIKLMLLFCFSDNTGVLWATTWEFPVGFRGPFSHQHSSFLVELLELRNTVVELLQLRKK